MAESKLMQDLHRAYHYIQNMHDRGDAKAVIQKTLETFPKEEQQKLSELVHKFTEKIKAQVGDLDHKVKDCGMHFKNACPHNNDVAGGKSKVPDVGDPDHEGPGYKDHNPEG